MLRITNQGFGWAAYAACVEMKIHREFFWKNPEARDRLEELDLEKKWYHNSRYLKKGGRLWTGSSGSASGPVTGLWFRKGRRVSSPAEILSVCQVESCPTERERVSEWVSQSVSQRMGGWADELSWLECIHEINNLQVLSVHKSKSVSSPNDISDDQTRPTCRTFMTAVGVRREGDVENDARKMGIVNRKQVAQDRDRWRTETTETLVFPG